MNRWRPYQHTDDIKTNCGFKSEELLGKGSYGSVYRVGSPDGFSKYAMKELEVNFTDAKYADFLMESTILSSCDHPNILKAYDIFVNCDENADDPNETFDLDSISKTLHYIVEKGDSDLAKFNEEPIANDDTIIEVFYGIVQGLYHLHKSNIIHGDLKPENIIMVNNIPKIADFSLSCIDCNQLKSYRIQSSPYRAPEIWLHMLTSDPGFVGSVLTGEENNQDLVTFDFPESKGKPWAKRGYYSKAVDVWSLGCIAWELLYRKSPRYHNNCQRYLFDYQNVAHSIAEMDYQKRRFETLNVPERLEPLKKIGLRCLYNDPDIRWDIESVRDALVSIYPELLFKYEGEWEGQLSAECILPARQIFDRFKLKTTPELIDAAERVCNKVSGSSTFESLNAREKRKFAAYILLQFYCSMTNIHQDPDNYSEFEKIAWEYKFVLLPMEIKTLLKIYEDCHYSFIDFNNE